jgi:nucleotide-binding universal stress UspA family protein
MKKFKKILCPYDFSDFAEEALSYAISLADKETIITLLHVIELPYHLEPNGMTYMYVDYDVFEKNAKEKLEAKTKEVQKKHKQIKFKSKIVVEINPDEGILNTQKTTKSDLIVMGSHGRRGMDRLLMGSVAESVFREATCPVLLIKK